MKKLITILLLSFILTSCAEEEECAEEDKIVKYTENTTYYHTTMDPELVCP